jgi:DnaJ-class molecular chaperone
VASEQNDSADQTEESHGPRECMPCRGTGKVISNLAGAPSTVTCPWCEGGGVRLAAVDAQAKWLGDEPAQADEAQAQADESE